MVGRRCAALTGWFLTASFWLTFLPALAAFAAFFSRLAALLHPLPPPMLAVGGNGKGRERGEERGREMEGVKPRQMACKQAQCD